MAENEIKIVVDVDDKASGKLNAIGALSETFGKVAMEAFQAFTSAATQAGQSAASAATQMASTAASGAAMGAETTAATGGLNILADAAITVAAALPLLIGGFLALAPAISAVGGAAAGAAGLLGGITVAAGTLFLGLGGLSKAWDAYGKAAAGGGGASGQAADQAYQRARRIEQAERSVADAKRSLTKATLDVAQAVAQERQRVEDLTLSLRGQKYAQQDAKDALDDALKQQQWANLYGDAGQREAAKKAVDRAQYRYDYETQKLKELQQEKDDADKKGIQGSDQVQAALERQRQAAEQVKVAQENLADAQRKTATASGGGAKAVDQFKAAMAALSPNAQKLIMTLIDLKDRFHGLKMAVQDRLLAGFDVAIRDLAEKWAPHLLPLLGGMADKLNDVGKSVLSSFGDSTFIQNVEKTAHAFEDFLGVLFQKDLNGKSGFGALLDSIGRLAANSGPVLHTFANILKDIAVSFDDWIAGAEKSGALQEFMKKAAGYLQQIYDIGKLTVQVIADFIEILFPSSDKAGKNVLDGLQIVLENVHKYLSDPKNQKAIREWVDKFVFFFDQLITKWVPDAFKFAKTLSEWIEPVKKIVGLFSSVYHWLSKNLPDAFKIVKNAMHGLFDPMVDAFKKAINWIIDRWNALDFSIGGGTFLGMNIPSAHFGTPNIGHLATGGVGSGLTMVGERGPELVNLAAGSQVHSAGDSARMMGGGGGQPIVVQLVMDGKVMVEKLVEPTRRFVTDRFGGSVQKAYGLRGVS